MIYSYTETNNVETILNGRKLYLDILRVMATLAVMMLHVAAQNWRNVDVTSVEWAIFNFYDGGVRWAVPIFVMISGALFLSRPIDMKRIFQKNISHMIIIFFVWSGIYAIIDWKNGRTLSTVLVNLIKGHYHMWFLLMIMGLYLLIPFLKKITEDKSLTRYFIFLSLVFSFIIPQLTSLLQVGDKRYLNLLAVLLDNIGFSFTLGFSSYFVIGYYLSYSNFSRKQRWSFYILGCLGLVMTILGNYYLSIGLGYGVGKFYHYFTINILAVSAGLFVFSKYVIANLIKNYRVQMVIERMSKYSLGAYLVHALIIEELRKCFGIHTLLFAPMLSCLVLWLIVIVSSYAISAIAHKIPKAHLFLV